MSDLYYICYESHVDGVTPTYRKYLTNYSNNLFGSQSQWRATAEVAAAAATGQHMGIWVDQPFDLCGALSSKVAQVSFCCDTI